MKTTDTLKEYYVSLQRLYNNAVNMLTAINQSLSTSSSEVQLTVMDTDDTMTTVRLPSFIYLENKLEQLQSNFNLLFEIPESGEAWFSNASKMHKLELIKSNSAPSIPNIDSTKSFVSMTTNNMLKDMVLPRMFVRVNIPSLTDNINDMLVKKMTISNKSLFNALKNNRTYNTSYEAIMAAIVNYDKGEDYNWYDTKISMPIKRNRFVSEFNILDIPKLESGNPWIESTNLDESDLGSTHSHTRYQLRLNTLTYHDAEDQEYTFNLKKGDLLCLSNDNVVYKVINTSIVNTADEQQCLVIIEEQIGHVMLQTTEENQNIVLQLYDNDYSEFKYIDIPLEEDANLILFVASLYDNVRSNWSTPLFIDLNDTYIVDADGNQVLENGAPISYIDYYNKYCTNVGDLIAGLSEVAYPQLSNYTSLVLQQLTNDARTQAAVTNSIDPVNDIVVKKINSHLTDTDLIDNVIGLHQEKSNINNKLLSIQSNIDQIYNQLITTDFKTELNITQIELKKKLDDLYTQRTQLTTQKINIVDNINMYKSSIKSTTESKFRVRGVSNGDMMSTYIKEITNDNKADVISMQVQYKYRSIARDTTNVTDINQSIFTDWIDQKTIDKARELVFNNNRYEVRYVNYDQITNIIRWNQIDIPIQSGEDVIIRIRYKLNIGQPFIDLYTPWSDEYVITFPTEFEENTEVSTILATNETDTISATFNRTLINDGYMEHISDKLIDNSKVYFHDAGKIYSGFMSQDNKILSVEEKLKMLDDEVYKYRTMIESVVNNNYKVYITHDDENIELNTMSINNIEFLDVADSLHFKKHEFNLIIRNEGSIPLKLYSMFSGVSDNDLYDSSSNGGYNYGYVMENYKDIILHYGLSLDNSENMKLQSFAQYIYFTRYNVYLKTLLDKDADPSPRTLLNDVYKGPLLDQEVKINPQSNTVEVNENIDTTKNFNRYSVRFEDITYKKDGTTAHINTTTNLSELSSDSLMMLNGDTISINDINGLGCVNTNLVNDTQLLCSTTDNISQFSELRSGESIVIPMFFEYYIGQDTDKSLDKVESSIAFSFRPNVLFEPVHYIIKCIGRKQ